MLRGQGGERQVDSGLMAVGVGVTKNMLVDVWCYSGDVDGGKKAKSEWVVRLLGLRRAN